LPGRGAPLGPDDDSAVPPEWRLAYRLLHGNGFAPAWIELGAAIRRELDQARVDLAWVDRTDHGRAGAEARYAACARALNRQIAQYNLKAPAPRWHIARIDVVRDCRDIHPASAAPASGAAVPPSTDNPSPTPDGPR
jgi:hypothetical protein